MMQAADIFYMKVDICQLGMDQRKVNMLAREVAKQFKKKKPIAVHHHMLAGLKEPPASDLNAIDKAIEMKMSKSDPDTAIFMLDSEPDIRRKIKKAFCPAGKEENNPILEYCKYIIFEKYDDFLVERPEKFGGNLKYSSYEDLAKDFVNEDLHPGDLKKAVANYINELIQPVRDHFENNEHAKELYQFVMKAQKKQNKSKKKSK